MSEYIINVNEKDECWHYVERQYTHFFGYPITEEIVRCRDCRYFSPTIYTPVSKIGICCGMYTTEDYALIEMNVDGFCSRGEKMESA